MTRVLRLAVVGAGRIGARHIEEIRALPGAALSAIVDVSAAAAALAQQADVPLFASIDELLARDRPDGIVLATPNALHAAQALACIDARVPALVEKPIAHTLADATRIRDAAELGRLVGVIGSAVFCKPDAYFAEAAW